MSGDHHGAVHETKLRARYAETDQMGIVYHSNFVIWFEVGRVELFRSLGFTYDVMERQDGCHLPVVDLRVRFKSPARYDDEVIIRTSVKNLRNSLLHFGYEVLRAKDRTLLAEGETTHIVTDENMQKRELPEKYRTALTGASAHA